MVDGPAYAHFLPSQLFLLFAHTPSEDFDGHRLLSLAVDAFEDGREAAFANYSLDAVVVDAHSDGCDYYTMPRKRKDNWMVA